MFDKLNKLAHATYLFFRPTLLRSHIRALIGWQRRTRRRHQFFVLTSPWRHPTASLS